MFATISKCSVKLCVRPFGNPYKLVTSTFFRTLYNVSTKTPEATTYDVAIIGGGSAGLALSKESALLGQKVILIDHVSPSPHGSKWGIGGTCVNVGCIPKKLMHQAALLAHSFKDAAAYGWQLPTSPSIKHDWPTLVKNVGEHIKSINWGYGVRMRDQRITYLNAMASFRDEHSLTTVDDKGTTKTIKANAYVIAVGGRPVYPSIPGSSHCVTSDDIFLRATPPGKTLVLGASYVALECAGFLAGLGYPTSVMARGSYLRGFDQQMANMVVDYMKNNTGVQFHDGFVATRIEQLSATHSGPRLRVYFKPTAAAQSQKETYEDFDTVLAAIGRQVQTDALNLDRAGVKLDTQTHKVLVGQDEQTNQPHIYALGDVAFGRPELTPTAIRSAQVLANHLVNQKRLLHSSQMRLVSLYPSPQKTSSFKSDMVPTTVFTPLEYSCVGLTEEQARQKLGNESVEVYHSHFEPLEWALPDRGENVCYTKIIVNLAEHEKVVGIHYLGPNAGEVMQGFATAIRLGVTKQQLESTLCIHPTNAEEIVRLEISKSSGLSPVRVGCCG